MSSYCCLVSPTILYTYVSIMYRFQMKSLKAQVSVLQYSKNSKGAYISIFDIRHRSTNFHTFRTKRIKLYRHFITTTMIQY